MDSNGNQKKYGPCAPNDAAVLRVLSRLAVILAGAGMALLFVLLAVAALAAVSLVVVGCVEP